MLYFLTGLHFHEMKTNDIDKTMATGVKSEPMTSDVSKEAHIDPSNRSKQIDSTTTELKYQSDVQQEKIDSEKKLKLRKEGGRKTGNYSNYMYKTNI
jgi:hypothetical protein